MRQVFSILLLQDSSIQNDVRQNVLSQHSTQIMGEFYLTLFLADGLPSEWRNLAQSYGISHIFAISGFHTGILSAMGFFLLGLLYKPLHARFFPLEISFLM